MTRLDQRSPQQMRPIQFEVDIAPHATGSVLVSFGNTRVICGATLEKKVPGWMKAEGNPGGWVTAEYSMLPYSTLDRKRRDSSKGKVDGRTIEIQRLIGRAMRAVIDLSKLPGRTLWIDCDVLQADGGTRTASISGAYLAAQLAIHTCLRAGTLSENPFKDSVAAVSVGIFEDTPMLDLNYLEDKDATVDFNVVMTGRHQFVELQGSGEESTFSEAQLTELITLARSGIECITQQQKAVLETSNR